LLVPTGKVKWFDSEKGFGFLARDDGGEVFVHSSALPAGTTALRQGQRVEFGIVEGRKGAQALQVHLLEAPPTVAVAPKAPRKKPDEMIPIIEDLMKILDSFSDVYRRGKHPDAKESKQVASLLRGLADDLDPAGGAAPAASSAAPRGGREGREGREGSRPPRGRGGAGERGAAGNRGGAGDRAPSGDRAGAAERGAPADHGGASDKGPDATAGTVASTGASTGPDAGGDQAGNTASDAVADTVTEQAGGEGGAGVQPAAPSVE
jgi:cold shock protein